MTPKQEPISSYRPERCGLCEGNGGASAMPHPCPVCQGTGAVLVHQPPLHCPRCCGNGRAKLHDDLKYRFDLCVVCLGTGWVMTEFH